MRWFSSQTPTVSKIKVFISIAFCNSMSHRQGDVLSYTPFTVYLYPHGTHSFKYFLCLDLVSTPASTLTFLTMHSNSLNVAIQGITVRCRNFIMKVYKNNKRIKKKYNNNKYMRNLIQRIKSEVF